MQLKIEVSLQTELDVIGILTYHPFWKLSTHSANLARIMRSVITHNVTVIL
jgi:hypothetical protein